MKKYLLGAVAILFLILAISLSKDETPAEFSLGASNTSSTNNKDVQLDQTNPTTNFGSTDALNIRKTGAAQILRSILHFTLPSGSGTITDVSLNLTKQTSLTATGTVNAHQLTQTGWVEDQATFNDYSTGNAWTSAGGDFSATIIDSVSDPANVGEVLTIYLMGDNATNPLTLNWGDDVHILLKQSSESGGTDTGGIYYSKENGTASNRPYLTITYTGGRRVIILE